MASVSVRHVDELGATADPGRQTVRIVGRVHGLLVELTGHEAAELTKNINYALALLNVSHSEET